MTVQETTVIAVRGSLRARHRDWGGIVLQGLLLLSLLFSLAVLLILIYDQLRLGMSVFLERGLDFLTSPLSSNPDKAGVAQGILGSAMLAVLVPLMAFPIGILSAVYLEEYAPDNRLTRFITINIRNLAGVPSVVYGLLGLSIFVAAFAALGLGNGRNIVAAAQA
jgi:phosphate transport system permease protein